MAKEAGPGSRIEAKIAQKRPIPGSQFTSSLLVDTSLWPPISRGVLANAEICYWPIHVFLAHTDYIVPSNTLANRAEYLYNVV